MAQDIRSRYPFIANVIVAHNAAHVSQPKLEERPDHPLTCGFLSNLSREKGLDVFFDCLRAARRAGINLKAVLAGPTTSHDADRIVADAKKEFGDVLNVLGPSVGCK